MPIFEVQGPDGKTYEVDAPDMNSAAEAIAPQQEQSTAQPDFGGIEGSQAAARQGMSFGFSDEIGGALAATLRAPFTDKTWGQEYQTWKGNEEGAADAYKKAHPYLGTAIEMGGGLLTGGGLIKSGLTLAGRGATMASRAGLGALEGAGYGAAYGAGTGNGMEDRLEGAAMGGALGAGVGAVAPVVGGAIGAGARRILDNKTVNNQLGRIGLDRPSADILSRTMQADDTLGQRGMQNIAAAGLDAMFADAGPNARSVLDTVIQRGGRGAMEAQRAIEGRASRANQNIGQALDQTLGTPQGVRTTETNLRTSTAGARQSAYDAAYGAPIDYAHPRGMELEGLLQRVPRNVISRANQLMKLEGAKSQQILIDTTQSGVITFKRMPDVRQIDYITRAMNDVAKAGDGRGALGGNTAEGRAFGNLSKDIRGALKDLVPEYGQALDTAAQPIQARNALQMGTEILRSNMPRDQVEEAVRGLSQSELGYLRQGIRSQIDEALANVRMAATDQNIDARQALQALKDLTRPAAKEKLRVVMGNGGGADTLMRTLDQAAKALELRAGTATNSRTFARLATNESVKEAVEPGPIATLAEGRPIEAGRRIIRALTGNTPAAKTAKEDVIYDRLARALTQRRGPQAQQDLSRLAQAMSAGQRNAATGDRLRRVVTGGVAIPGYLAGQQYLSRRSH